MASAPRYTSSQLVCRSKTANSRYVNSRHSILTCQIEKLSQNANYEWMTTITPKAFANLSPGVATANPGKSK
jgi:hypothetical protein